MRATSQNQNYRTSTPQESAYLDLTDPQTLTNLFKPTKSLSRDEAFILKSIRVRKYKQDGKRELIDFHSRSLPQIRDGNTLLNGRFVRRGLPHLEDSMQVPPKQNFEMISYLKPNGDCCMFTYVDKAQSYLIATRTQSVLVRNTAQLTPLVNDLHKAMGKLWFQFLDQLEQPAEMALQQELQGHTWVGEMISSDNMVDYKQSYLLMHSIVDNLTGHMQGNAHEVFKKYGFQTVPCKSLGTMDSLAMIIKIEDLKKETASLPMSQTHEGIVIQLVDKKLNQVHSIMKVKSIEYTLFSMMHDQLQQAIERGEIDTQFEKIVLQYGKEHKALVKSQDLPHPESFYWEVYQHAMSCVSQRKNPGEYQSFRSTLYSDQKKFFTEVIASFADKKANQGGKHYTGLVDFSNHTEFLAEPPTIDMTKLLVQSKQVMVKQKRASVMQLIVVVCPPYCLRKTCVDQLAERFHLHTPDSISSFSPGTIKAKGKRNLLLVESLDGVVESLEKRKLQFTLVVYRVTDRSPRDLVKNLWEDQEKYFTFKSDVQSSNSLRRAIQKFEASAKSLEDVVGEELISTMFSNESELMMGLGRLVEGDDFDEGGLTDEERDVEHRSEKQHQDERGSKVKKSGTVNRDDNSDEEYHMAPSVALVKRGRSSSVSQEQERVEKPEKQRGRSQSQDPNSIQNERPKKNPKILDEQAPVLKQKRIKRSQNKQIFVLIPVGLAGMSREDFIKTQLEPTLQNTHSLQVLSDHDVRKEAVDRYLLKQKGKTYVQAVRATEGQVALQFKRLLQQTLDDCQAEESKDFAVIYLNRTYTPNQLQKQITQLSELDPDVFSVALVPQKNGHSSHNPFSLSQLLECYCRELNLTQQESTVTMHTEDEQALFKRMLYLYVQFEKFDEIDFGEGHVLEVDLSLVEGKQPKLPQEIADVMAEAVQSFVDTDESLEEVIQECVEVVNSYRRLFGATQSTAVVATSQQKQHKLGQLTELIESVVGKIKRKPMGKVQSKFDEDQSSDQGPQEVSKTGKTQKPRTKQESEDEGHGEEEEDLDSTNRGRRLRQVSQNRAVKVPMQEGDEKPLQKTRQTRQLKDESDEMPTRKPRANTPRKETPTQTSTARAQKRNRDEEETPQTARTQKRNRDEEETPQTARTQKRNRDEEETAQTARTQKRNRDEEQSLSPNTVRQPRTTKNQDRIAKQEPDERQARVTKLKTENDEPGKLRKPRANTPKRYPEATRTDSLLEESRIARESQLPRTSRLSNDTSKLRQTRVNTPKRMEQTSTTKTQDQPRANQTTQRRQQPDERQTSPAASAPTRQQRAANKSPAPARFTQIGAATRFQAENQQSNHDLSEQDEPVKIKSLLRNGNGKVKKQRKRHISFNEEVQVYEIISSTPIQTHEEQDSPRQASEDIEIKKNEEMLDKLINKSKNIAEMNDDDDVEYYSQLPPLELPQGGLVKPVAVKEHVQVNDSLEVSKEEPASHIDTMESEDVNEPTPRINATIVANEQREVEESATLDDASIIETVDHEAEKLIEEEELTSTSVAAEMMQDQASSDKQEEADSKQTELFVENPFGKDLPKIEEATPRPDDDSFVEETKQNDDEVGDEESERKDFTDDEDRAEGDEPADVDHSKNSHADSDSNNDDDIPPWKDLPTSLKTAKQTPKTKAAIQKPTLEFEVEEDTRVPDMYVLNPRQQKGDLLTQLGQAITQQLETFVSKMLPNGEIDNLKELFVSREKTSGWSLTEQTALVDYIQKDQFKLESSRAWQEGFQANRKTPVEIVGFFIVPTWIIVAVCLPVEDIIDVPCIVVAQHESWQQEGEDGIMMDTIELCEQAVQYRTSAFRNMVRRPSAPGGAKKGKMFREAELRCKFDEEPVQAVYVSLDQTISSNFQTQIIY